MASHHGTPNDLHEGQEAVYEDTRGPATTPVIRVLEGNWLEFEKPPRPPTSVHAPNVQQRSEALKERVYVTSTTLAVTLAYERDAEHATVQDAALTLILTVLGTLIAVFVADVIAHMVRDSTLPSGRELVHLGYVSFGSAGVVVAPMALLGLSASGLIDVATALRAISATLAVTLVMVTLLAVRRLRVGFWRKAFALAITAALGLAALGIELALHQ